MSENSSDRDPSNGSASPIDTSDSDPAKDAKELFEKMNLEIGSTVVDEKSKIPVGTLMAGDIQMKVTTNVYGLLTKEREIRLYHLELQKTLRDGRTRALVRENYDYPMPLRKESDFMIFENRKIHKALFQAFVVKYPGVFGTDPDQFCYDYASDLFSLIEIVPPNADMILTPEEVYGLIDRPYSVSLKLQPTDKAFDVREFKVNFNADLAEHDSSVIRFLELATSRFAAEKPEEFLMYESKNVHFMNPEQYGFNTSELSGGKYLSAGISKSVVCIEGPKLVGAPAVVIDSKKTPFYESENLLKVICKGVCDGGHPPMAFSPNQWIAANKYIKRLDVYPVYGNRQKIPVTLRCLSQLGASDTYFQYGDRRISVYQYLVERYDVYLKFPHLPMAMTAKKVNGSNAHYPLEFLFIADNQRVSNGNISTGDIASIVKACAVPPYGKKQEIGRCLEALSFNNNDGDGFMIKADLKVKDVPLDVNARVLKPPVINYANFNRQAGGDGRWKLPNDAHYLRPCEIKKAAAVLIKGRYTLGKFREFVRFFTQECNKRGIAMPEINYEDVWEIAANEASVEGAIKETSEYGFNFLLIGHPDEENTLHPFIKGMERKYQVITQCVRTKTMMNIVDNRKYLALENIVAKTNIKCGGVNYSTVVPSYAIDDHVLFIGLAVNQPAGGLAQEVFSGLKKIKTNGSDSGESTETFEAKNCSILGFAANDGIMPNEFIGNFFIQSAFRDEKINVMDELIEEVIERFKSNRNYLPSRVIFYRSGASEGAFSNILRYEVPIIKNAIKKRAPEASITVIVPSKAHSVRLFKNEIFPHDRPNEQNILPGTVIDQHLVSKVFPEFYLNSHLAIQGTAKTPKFTILFNNDPDAKMDMLERWTNGLAYEHQIVTSPTSLPAPVFIANRYAERGRQIFNSFGTGESYELSKNGPPDAVPNDDGSIDSVPEKSRYYWKSVSYNFTNKETLRQKRINA